MPANYVSSLRSLILSVQEMGSLPHVVLMIIPPLFVDGAHGLRADVIALQLPDAITQLAHEHGCHYWT